MRGAGTPMLRGRIASRKSPSFAGAQSCVRRGNAGVAVAHRVAKEPLCCGGAVVCAARERRCCGDASRRKSPRVGYACTLMKVQGANVDHLTLWLDVPNVEAAGYVALSRVRRDADWQYVGDPGVHHFTPAFGAFV